MMRTSSAIALAVVVGMSGCTSSYMPRTPNRVAVMTVDGQPTYVRDGISHRHGILGGGLIRAVAGHPGAEATAREYRSRLINGLLLVTAGCIATMVGVTMATTRAVNDERAEPYLWATLGGLVATFAGAGYAISAEPLRWDAINMFNDMPPPPPYRASVSDPPRTVLDPLRPWQAPRRSSMSTAPSIDHRGTVSRTR